LRTDTVFKILHVGLPPTYDEDRARLYVLNRITPWTKELREERWAIQGRLSAQGFYGPVREEREDSEGEAMIQRMLDSY